MHPKPAVWWLTPPTPEKEDFKVFYDGYNKQTVEVFVLKMKLMSNATITFIYIASLPTLYGRIKRKQLINSGNNNFEEYLTLAFSRAP